MADVAVTGRVVGRYSWLIGFHAALFLVFMAEPAGADNCQTFTDCFLTAGAASDSALGMAFLGMLSMGLNFVPYVGTAKGMLEAVIGHDLLTGQELSMTDRLLGLIPGGRLGRLGRGDEVFDMARMGPAGRGSDLSRASPSRAGPPPPPPGRGGGGGRPPPPPPPGRGPGSPDPDGRWNNRPARTNNTEPTTRPDHGHDPNRRAGGDDERLPDRPRRPREPMTERQQRRYDQQVEEWRSEYRNKELQNQNAHLLEQSGFRVERPGHHTEYVDGRPVNRTADYEINGQRFDHKVMRTNNVRNFVDNQLENKAVTYRNHGNQADRFVVDLSHTNVTPQQLRAEIMSRNLPGDPSAVQEVFVIRNNEIIPIYP